MSSYKTKKTPGNTGWFKHDRFGMFIHWGLYAMPARGEWIKLLGKMSEEQYEKYFKYFNPDMYDPRDWAKRAKAAGMKYAVMTAKHHEGFCMFDSKYTDYKCTNTLYGRDFIKEYVEAFRAEGLKVGIYYSLIDWHHPEFVIDWKHPRRDDPGIRENSEKRDMKKYAEYMRNQVEELLTNYGKIDIMWFDFSYKKDPDEPDWMRGKDKDDWESEKLIALARSIQPEIIIDNRAGIEQDIWTPEQYQPLDWIRHKETGELLTWESCQTLSGSWGYNRDEMTWKSPKMLIELLINNVSRGGNLLMNVGPTARGYLDNRTVEALDAYEKWMKYNSRSIYGCTKAEPEFTEPRGCRLTQSEDGKRLYIHLLEYPYKFLEMKGIKNQIDYAQFLHDGSEVTIQKKNEGENCAIWDYDENAAVFSLPPVKPGMEVPVIEIFLK